MAACLAGSNIPAAAVAPASPNVVAGHTFPVVAGDAAGVAAVGRVEGTAGTDYSAPESCEECCTHSHQGFV